MVRKALIPVLAVAAVSTAAPAMAQHRGPHHDRGHHNEYAGWQNINQRQTQLDRRIDQGVRNGALSRREASSLRAEFYQIARLESRYRAGGLTRWERADLDRRFDSLSARIRYERRDGQGRRVGW